MSTFSMNGSPTCTDGRLEGLVSSNVSRRQDRRAADAVAARARTEQDHLVARARGVGQVDVLVPQDAEAQRVDQRVALVGGVEHQLAADVGQAEGVAVAADAGHDAVHHARGVGVVDGAEPQLVHDRDRARAHRDDVAHDAADARGRALVRLDVGRVVVRLDLERHRPAVADVHDARVLADADEQVLLHGVGGLVAELAQVVLARLVRAVLRPHDRVHGELGGRGAAAEDVADALVLVRLQAQLRERLLLVGGRGGDVDGVGLGGARRCGGHRFPRWRPVGSAPAQVADSAADVGRRAQDTGARTPSGAASVPTSFRAIAAVSPGPGIAALTCGDRADVTENGAR